jgi:hypothetical protein
MANLAWLLWSIAAVPSASGDAAVRAEAAAFEEQAFAAVDKEQWCRAARLFEKANSLAPAVDLLTNAAQAAEFGGDLAGARVFWGEVATASPAAQRADARAKVAALDKRIAKAGPGTQCPPLPAPTPAATSPAPPVSPPASSSTTSAPAAPAAPPAAALPSTTDVSASTTSSTAKTPEPPSPRTWAWVLGGVGGGVVAVGGVVAGLGATSWFAHVAAVEKIAAAERDRVDATKFQAEQIEARVAWESWGQALTVVGSVGVGVGVAAAAGGVGWAVLGPEAAE